MRSRAAEGNMDLQTPRMNLLKTFITDRLTFAADEIFVAVEKMLGEYQEEVRRMMEENGRLRRQDLVSKPQMKRDLQSYAAKEQVGPGQQLWEQDGRSSLGQENPEPTLVKEEEEALWTTEEEEQLPGLDSDTNDFILTSPCVTTNFDQFQHQPASLYLTQTMENGEMSTWDSQPATVAPQIKTEPDVEGYGGPASTSDSLLFSLVNPYSTDGVESSRLLQSALKPLVPLRKENHSAQVKRFQCNICGKCFSWKSVFDRHCMIHTGARPFRCKVCGKCFNRTSVLIRHMIVHTGATETFQCTECSKCFNRKHHLIRHMMIHSRAFHGSPKQGIRDRNGPSLYPSHKSN